MQCQEPVNVSNARVAIVTGAAQGIGRSVALRLADDGVDVAVNDISAKLATIEEVVGLIQAKGRRAIAVPADVSSEVEVQTMVEKTVAELGTVDIMVANAGIVELTSFMNTSLESFNRIMSINATGVFLCFHCAAKQMIKQARGGRLVAASSIAGITAVANPAAYSASKFAVRGIMQAAALELREHNITSNAYAPGHIKTPMAMLAGQDWHESVKQALGDIPAAEPEVIASIVSYLCKPEAYFVTGQTISVNGGVLLQ